MMVLNSVASNLYFRTKKVVGAPSLVVVALPLLLALLPKVGGGGGGGGGTPPMLGGEVALRFLRPIVGLVRSVVYYVLYVCYLYVMCMCEEVRGLSFFWWCVCVCVCVCVCFVPLLWV